MNERLSNTYGILTWIAWNGFVSIISIPSPTGHEQAKGEWILNLLHQWGRRRHRDAAGNVVYPCHV